MGLFDTAGAQPEEQDTASPQASGIPSYLIAADTHNIANNQYSMLESAGYGAAGVVGSALVQTLNIAPTIGNWLGGDFEQIKTKDVLQSFDDDLGKYYEGHQEGIDALGFAVSSLVPGTGGVKIFRGGQLMLRTAAESGTFGAGLGRSLGLLAPSQPKLLASAIETALKPNAGFPIWNANTLKAVAAGFGQSAMEGAAFETAVAATMYNSPVLEKQDFSDITSNIMHGALVFGALGGVANTASTYFKIAGAGRVVDREAMPWSYVREAHKTATPSEKILTLLEDYHTTEPVPSAETFGQGMAWKVDKYNALREEKFRTIDLKVRELTGELSGGDQQLADSLFGKFKSMDLDQVTAKLYGSEEVTRLGTATAFEKESSKLVKEAAKTLDEEGLAAKLPNKELSYVKLAGASAGKIQAEAPALINIADKLSKGQEYSKVVAGYGEKLTKEFDPLIADPLRAEARYVTALSHNFKPTDIVSATDLPYLQAAYLKGVPELQVRAADKTVQTLSTKEELFDLLQQQKLNMMDNLNSSGVELSKIAKVLDISEDLVSGVQKGTLENSLIQTVTGKEFAEPQWAKVVKDLTPVKDIDDNVVTGLIAIKQKQKLYEQAADRAVAHVLGEDYSRFFRLTDQQVLRANRTGPGGGLFSSQNENYGTLGSLVQYLGQQTLKTVEKFRSETRDFFTGDLHALANNQPAAIEFATLNANLRSIPETFAFDATQGAMRPLKLIKYEQALAAGEKVALPVIDEGIPLSIPIKYPEVAKLVESHIAKNGENLDKLGAIRQNQGLSFRRDPAGFYPVPANPKDYPYFAFVVDDSLQGYGRSKMVHAADQAQLEKIITSVKEGNPSLKVLTKADAENYYKSIGQYDYERTLTDATFDVGLQRKGVSSSYLVPTDPQKIVNDFLNWHLDRQTNLVREAVLHQNESAVTGLREMGESYAKVKGSHFSAMDPMSYVQMQERNPYADYVKSMLGLSTSKEFPFWTPLNDMLDRKFSSLFNSVSESFKTMKSPAELDSINKMLTDAGYKGAAYDAMTNAFANHTAGKGVLSSFVAKANAILATGMLRWDPINALNNTIGANVLVGTELKAVQRAIAQGNPDAIGDLASLLALKVPGTDNVINSAGKLIANSMGRFHSSDELRALYKERGFISSVSDQYKHVLDNLTITGTESAAQLDSKINSAFAAAKSLGEAGEKYTGNRLAEEFNRFVAADVMKQITDVGVKAGVISEKESWAYINTFVNRTQGNYIAAQRPGIFQGPVGQAVGLFQTYQFNLMQQLLRHVGEGSGKDAAIMMGLQSTLYGMKGLPAFDAINTHILGNASGNTQHRDLYDAVYGTVGKEAGDWLMYGAGSNALGLISPDLKLNLYTRGDINPRNITLLPVNPADVPFVQASAKLWSSVAETTGKIAQGGAVWGSMMQGIEHAGVNRPLAGLAQTLEGLDNPYSQSYSTSNKGNVQMSNDMLSLANLIRLTGAKPLDEAIGIDRVYNIDSYSRKDASLRQALGETIKTTVIAGKEPSQDQIDKFSYEYAKAGGRQDKFGSFMLQQYKTANQSQVNVLAQKLNSPFSQSMQRIMGGYSMEDLHNSPTGR